tara:strand:- start:1854 stop:2036 length:183 start_codon:yes stop_codon:yes gene_type:complete
MFFLLLVPFFFSISEKKALHGQKTKRKKRKKKEKKRNNTNNTNVVWFLQNSDAQSLRAAS